MYTGCDPASAAESTPLISLTEPSINTKYPYPYSLTAHVAACMIGEAPLLPPQQLIM